MKIREKNKNQLNEMKISENKWKQMKRAIQKLSENKLK